MRAKYDKPHLPAQEQKLYAALAEWSQSEKPMLLFWYVTHSQRTGDYTYKVEPLSDGLDEAHYVDLQAGTCSPCKGFAARQTCSHLKAMAVRSRIEFSIRNPESTGDEATPEPRRYTPRRMVDL